MYKISKHIIYNIILTCVVFCFMNTAQAQISDRFKANAIINEIAANTNWENEKSIEQFKIAVYGFSGVLNQLKRMSSEAFINGKQVQILQFKKLTDIQYVHIIFVPQTRIADLHKIVKKLNKNTLIITDQCPRKIYMINFRKKNIHGKYIDISYLRAKMAGITFDEVFINAYGKEEDIKRLITFSQKKYDELKKHYEKQQKEIIEKKKELKRLEIENDKELEENEKQRQISERQAKEIAAQKKTLAEKELMLDSIERDLVLQQKTLKINQAELDKQKVLINGLADSMQNIVNQLDSQKEQIAKNQKIIGQKEDNITEQSDHIKVQRLSIFGLMFFFIAIVIMGYYSWRAFRSTKKINTELSKRNIDIKKQKEEIQRQNEQTELLNEELFKLSVVAEQTDNAVTIMDADGNFEWVNAGYTKMYGYTLQLLLNEKGDNLLEVSTEKNIKQIFEQCISKKSTMVYETLNTTRAGEALWVQVSLTPILDTLGNIEKLITVSIDINRMKEAENNLRNIHNKVLKQSKELEAVNKELDKLSLVARETDNAIAIMDIAGNYQWINEAYSRLFGYTYNQLITEYSRNIINKDATQYIKDQIKKCIENEVSVSYEEHKTCRDGSKIWAHTTLSLVRGNDNRLQSIISISQNIEELKKSEQAILDLNQELEQQHDELLFRKDKAEKLNERILSSIDYARTMQANILPIKANIDKHFDSFIIFRPKDIVSGDFYWYATIPSVNGGGMKHIIAAVDCTGHGVPGAFMSLIGYRLLNEIVKVKGIRKPNQILDNLNKMVKKSLRQEKNRNNDGMDVCICSFERIDNNTLVEFAGAKRPLYYYKKNKQELNYIKGARRSIGGTQVHRNLEEFANSEIILEKGDCVYLSTDGIIDQPAPSRIRFGSVRFRNIIDEVANEPLDVQKMTIETTLENYRQTAEQRDDITLLGIKV